MTDAETGLLGHQASGDPALLRSCRGAKARATATLATLRARGRTLASMQS